MGDRSGDDQPTETAPGPSGRIDLVEAEGLTGAISSAPLPDHIGGFLRLDPELSPDG
jgi:hypothetical protein